MRTGLRLLSTIILFGLASCATHHNINKSVSINQCKMVCTQRAQECAGLCVDSCRNCSTASCRATALRYSKYIHEQRIEGAIIARELNSYRDPLQCRKITCNCAADFNTCTQNCTGIIQKRLQSVPYCT